MRRFGQIIGVDPDRIEEYAEHHSNIWPEIVEALDTAQIRNYSIYFFGEQLFAYFEYHGPDEEFETRMEAVSNAPRMAQWWETVGPMQRPLDARGPGEWWMNMREVFHLDAGPPTT